MEKGFSDENYGKKTGRVTTEFSERESPMLKVRSPDAEGEKNGRRTGTEGGWRSKSRRPSKEVLVAWAKVERGATGIERQTGSEGYPLKVVPRYDYHIQKRKKKTTG